MNITEEMVDLAVKVYRPADRGDRRTTREAMRDALVAVSDDVSATPIAVDQIPQQPQRQDSLDEQLRDVGRAATKLGCYDAADWIRSAVA